ncbi:hypothetical protein C8J57DRAFT_1329869 [Mycena rebaudengoi]|nr:hypothetical protein C8J57DRAFT_1329869 [Mycena rebaudengoi]
MATPAQSPRSAMAEVLDECPRFRVLVVGKSGAGKSSLINYAFGVDRNSVSHQKPGECDINFEIESTQNTRFVAHDSMGFEHGDRKNFEDAKTFLESRSGVGVALGDRVHIIWLCVQVPHAGARLFETGDEDFLKVASSVKVPVLVVFTQFDKLVNSMYWGLTAEEKQKPTEQTDVLCAGKALREFEKLCIDPLKGIDPKVRSVRVSGLAGKPHSKPDRQALAILIDRTQRLVEDLTNVDSKAVVPIVSANAQRANAEVKINNSIELGMKRYWKGLASSTKFLDWKFETCLTALHEEITDSWNFNDPANLLNGPKFVQNIKILAQLVTPDDTEAKSLFGNLEGYQALVGLGTAIVGAAAGPAVAAIGLSVFFTQWIAKAYDTTPAALRCFMGCIIDLTLVLDQLFLVGLSTNVPRPLTPEDITEAVENHKRLHLADVHREIRQYVHSAPFKDIMRSNKAELKVKELLKRYCAKGTGVSGTDVTSL